MEPAETAGFPMAMIEGYVSLAKNAQDAKVSNGEEKHGGAPVPARAGQPQAGLIASVPRDGLTPLHTNRFVCSERIPQFDCKHVDARERTEGLMETGKAQICPSE